MSCFVYKHIIGGFIFHMVEWKATFSVHVASEERLIIVE